MATVMISGGVLAGAVLGMIATTAWLVGRIRDRRMIQQKIKIWK